MTERDYAEEMIAVARPYWAAEAEITRRFFAGSPDREAFLRYLRAAVYKELNPVIGYGPSDGYANGLHMEFSGLIDRFDKLDRDEDRRAMLARLRMMTEEFEHYVVLAEVLEFALGRPLTPDDPEQLGEDRKLNEMRRRYVESGDSCLNAAMGLTEGGGSSSFGVAASLSGGELEERLARAMKVIYTDEANHYQSAAKTAAALVSSSDDLERMKTAIREISRQRVEMRYEMFSEPMSRDEVENVIAGYSV